MSNALPTLYEIESALSELMAAREEVTDPAEISQIDQALQEYARNEVRKVDNIRAYLKHCDVMQAAAKAEADLQSARAKMWESRKERLKELVKGVMTEFKATRLEGRTGTLRIQANGGKVPVLIHSEHMIPDEFCVWRGTITAKAWSRLRDLTNGHIDNIEGVLMQREVLKAAVEWELERDCPACEGHGGHDDLVIDGRFVAAAKCEVCGGTGHKGVPGASLGERGVHVRCT